jgi:hypothetical protein
MSMSGSLAKGGTGGAGEAAGAAHKGTCANELSNGHRTQQ